MVGVPGGATLGGVTARALHQTAGVRHTLRFERGTAILRVCDEGPGIPVGGGA